MEIQEPLCARCARHQQTCCQDSDIYVTTQDVARISAHVGHSDFTEYRVASDPVYLNEHHDPLWMEKVFRPDGSRRVLKQQPNLDCIFLGNQGCVLPTEVRPLICRLYPVEFSQHEIRVEPARCCPRELLAPGESVFDAVGVKLEDAVRWHAMLYQELAQES